MSEAFTVSEDKGWAAVDAIEAPPRPWARHRWQRSGEDAALLASKLKAQRPHGNAVEKSYGPDAMRARPRSTPWRIAAWHVPCV